MKKPIISLIAALAGNRAIGKDNKLLWHISEDLKRFKRLTSGHPVIMGRKTFESIGKPLPNRTNIIITRDPGYTADGCVVVNSLEKAIEEAKKVEAEELFIIGGAQIFNQSLPIADKLYLTLVEGDFDGDVFFPDYSEFNTIVHQENKKENGFIFTFIDLVK